MKSILGFRSRKEGKNIPDDILQEFQLVERRLLESNGQKNPYSIIWNSLARRHTRFDGEDSNRKQSAESGELDKFSSGRQDISSRDAEPSGDDVPIPSIPSGNIENPKAPRRTLLAGLFRRKVNEQE